MAVTQITFDDKVSTITSPLPEINRITGSNVNEIKDVVNNNADELSALQTTVAAIQPAVMVTSDTATLSVGALSTATGNITLTNSGYFPSGVAGITSSSSNCGIDKFYLSDVASGTAKVNYTFYNRSSGAGSPTITVYVNWIKIN